MKVAQRAGLVMLGAVAVSAPGCAGTLSLGAEGEVPNLVAVEPGVWVVEGRSEPVFYSDGYYWRYARDNWYSSRYLDGGFTYAPPPRVPLAVRGIDRPYSYSYYRAPRGTTVRPVPREHLRGPDYDDRSGTARRYDERAYDPRYERPYEDRRYEDPRYGERPHDPRGYDERYDDRGARRFEEEQRRAAEESRRAIEEQQRRDAEEARREVEEERRELEELQRLEREREAYRRDQYRRGY